MFNKKFIKIFGYVVLSIAVLILLVNVVSYIKITTSGIYDLAKTHMESHEDLIHKIGEVQSFGNFPTGGIGYENGKKTAEVHTTVVGSKLSGKVILLMEKWPNKEWEYTHLIFEKDE